VGEGITYRRHIREADPKMPAGIYRRKTLGSPQTHNPTQPPAVILNDMPVTKTSTLHTNLTMYIVAENKNGKIHVRETNGQMENKYLGTKKEIPNNGKAEKLFEKYRRKGKKVFLFSFLTDTTATTTTTTTTSVTERKKESIEKRSNEPKVLHLSLCEKFFAKGIMLIKMGMKIDPFWEAYLIYFKNKHQTDVCLGV
jgi:hypothetical protein